MTNVTPQHTFYTFIEWNEEKTRVEVTYEIRDIGVMMKPREKMRAIPVRVTPVRTESDILPDLCWDLYTELRGKAAAHAIAEEEQAKETWGVRDHDTP